MKTRRWISAAVFSVLALPLFGQAGQGSAKESAPKGEFFIVSSIDIAKQQILLKRPTEVTKLMGVDGSTRYLEEHGRGIRLTDLRAGDTVYVVSKLAGQLPVAVTIQKGPMTVEVLRERFLKTARNP